MIQSSNIQVPTEHPWGECEVPISSEYGRIKRLLDLYRMDEDFREAFHRTPHLVTESLGLPIRAEDLHKTVHPHYVALSQGRTGPLPDDTPPELAAYLALRDRQQAERIRRRDHMGPSHTKLAAWRRRQIARCRLQLPTEFYDTIMHGPFAIELSSGCSAGCWFCAVSAQEFKGHFPHRTEEAALFRGVLNALHELQGTEFAREGVLYWATDPLDNPEYEYFLDDFVREFGRAPTTTTSLAAVDLERTRRLLDRIASHSCWFQRFSIVKKRDLRSIMDAFSPEETANVEFLPAFSKLQPLTRSGRALEVAARQDARGKEAPEQLLDQESTCACVTGFLVNMVERTVSLISPHPATPDAPHGYLEFGQRNFTDIGEFERVINELADAVGDPSLDPDDVVGLPHGVRVSYEAPHVLIVHGQSCTLRLQHPAITESLVRSLERPTTCLEFVSASHDTQGIAAVFDLLNQLHGHGVISRQTEDARP